MTSPGRASAGGGSAGRALLVAGALAVALVVLREAGLAAPAAPTGAGGSGGAVAPKERVKIVFQTVPPVPSARVMWGGKKLGEIKGRGKALIIERPRDSGPLDVVIRAEGYLPVHTRAYTFSDAKVFVKLTPEEEKHKLFGYREELPPDGGATDASGATGAPGPTSARDGGVPPGP
jgi:hypothetical protein